MCRPEEFEKTNEVRFCLPVVLTRQLNFSSMYDTFIFGLTPTEQGDLGQNQWRLERDPCISKSNRLHVGFILFFSFIDFKIHSIDSCNMIGGAENGASKLIWPDRNSGLKFV